MNEDRAKLLEKILNKQAKLRDELQLLTDATEKYRGRVAGAEEAVESMEAAGSYMNQTLIAVLEARAYFELEDAERNMQLNFDHLKEVK